MCVILPVDHLSCTHTVAIWQHCIDAPRSRVHTLGPCSHIRQHPRPILTRKLCYNCGGPRYFARRGGIAERGRGSSETIPEEEEKEEKEEHNDPNDSGYASDAIMEEDEDADSFSLSPRSPRIASNVWSGKQNAHAAKQTGTLRYRSPSRKPSWKPSLKRELGGDNSPFCRRESVDSSVSSVSSVSKFEDEIGRAPRSYWPTEPASQQDATIIHAPSSSPRKNSTLLHPSSPPTESSYLQTGEDYPFPPSPILRPYTPPTCTTPPRTPSTLLHPSTPEPPMDLPITQSFPFPSRPSTPPQRPSLGARNNSTLLHPSPPSSTTTVPLHLTLPLRQTSTKPAPSVKVVAPTAHRESVLHSSFSDAEYESDDAEGEADTESFEDGYMDGEAECVDYVVARAGMVSRASRISFHGAQIRVLQTL